MDVITTHINADFDAVASMAAVKKFYPDAILVFPGAQEKSVRDFLSKPLHGIESYKIKDINLDNISRLILVDVKNKDRIGQFAEILDKKRLVIHIYDHHPFTPEDIKGQKVVIEPVGATTTIFTEMIQQNKINISPVEALVLLVMMEDTTYIIARSRVVEANVSEIVQPFNGGGHSTAASAVVKDISLEEIEEKLVTILKEKIKPTKTAKDIMTSPVKSILIDDIIKNAEQTMTRYGVNVLPVLQDDIYKGIISREVVEKALFHGFGKSKVSEFCTTDAITAAPNTPMQEVEAFMIEQNQRFTPVIENEQIIGA